MGSTLTHYREQFRAGIIPAIGGILCDALIATGAGYVGYTSVAEILLYDLHRLRLLSSISPATGSAPFALRASAAILAILLYWLSIHFSHREQTPGQRLFAATLKGALAPANLVAAAKSNFCSLPLEGTNLVREYFSVDHKSLGELASHG